MQINELSTLVRSAFADQPQAFRPCAFFDNRLDCIRVITKDCNVLEMRVNDRITILLDLYASRDRCVGFTLKGAQHLCQQHQWDPSRPIKMGQLLDGILESVPEKVVRVFIELVARPLVEEKNIEQVEVPEAALEPA